MNILPVFYPEERRIWGPGLINTESSSLISVSRAEVVEDDVNTGLKSYTVGFVKGVPRTIGPAESVIRWLMDKSSLKLLYCIAPTYPEQRKLLLGFYQKLNLQKLGIIRCELTGLDPLVIPGNRSDCAVRNIILLPNGRFHINWQFIGTSYFEHIGYDKARNWWWASESLREEAARNPDPDAFISEVIENLFV